MLATLANMRIAYAKYGNRVIMVDYFGNEFSANPADYFYVDDNYVFTASDEPDEPNELVVPCSGWYRLDDDGSIVK